MYLQKSQPRTKFDGAWSKKGCSLVEETEEHTTCSCNHLTNFAVLLEVGETKLSDDDRFALEMVTYIGCSLSFVGEMLTILIYLVLMNLKSTQSHIRLNLAFQTVVVTSAVFTNILLNGNMNNVMRDDVCWFSFSSGFVWVFAGSVLAACLVVILLRITLEIMRLKDMSGISETRSFRQSLKACVILFPLLGLTWIFGVLTVTAAGLVFQYLFTILNSLQGFFIFLFHVVRSKEIRTALETKRHRWETSRSVSMANEKSTLGRKRSSTGKQKHAFMTTNKISPETVKKNKSSLPTVE
ncbi:hypothetical protein OS493_034271 [Desmophyllum pertusum]|uniref:Uncharacterized protein n=1 Tax=Desmophyllum pertusum TaxID=174260 RepID=A0A9X0CQ34_9CNID|nr:hypothetical protein OS493_034271 [Desmophyllum pertusum]